MPEQAHPMDVDLILVSAVIISLFVAVALALLADMTRSRTELGERFTWSEPGRGRSEEHGWRRHRDSPDSGTWSAGW
jgi:hypothetical protein